MDDKERLWGVPETSAYLGVPEATLYQRRHRSYGPRDRRVGRYVRHDPARSGPGPRLRTRTASP